MIKNIKQWNSGKAFTMVEQYYLKALLNREQDKKNNPLVENDYYSPANNNHKLYELGCSVNMINQPYQPTVVKRSK
jgi:hypothetical protein